MDKDKMLSDEEIAELQILGNFIAEAMIRISRNTKSEDWEDEDSHDLLLGELAKCYTLQEIYLSREEYERCSVIALRIKMIHNKLIELHGYDKEELETPNPENGEDK